MGSERPDFKSVRPDLGSERPDLGSERHDLRQQGEGDGWMDGQPLGPLPQKCFTSLSGAILYPNSTKCNSTIKKSCVVEIHFLLKLT